MYLKRIRIERIKCFEALELHFPHAEEDYSGWVVLLGGNGTGKSTLLQAMALTLVGPLAGQRLLQPQGWVSSGVDYGTVTAEIVKGPQDSQAAGQPRRRPYEAPFAVTGHQTVELGGQPYDQPQLVLLADASRRKALASGPYAAKRPGWFSCGYGPFRRLSGGDAAEAKLVYSQGVEARFATLFRESAALTMCQDWLTQLYARSIDPSNPQREQGQRDFETVRDVINHLLPGVVRIERVDTTTVYFRTVGGACVPVPDLSDGYRSFLALVVDMLRHMVESNSGFAEQVELSQAGVHINVEGVVLIDEADAHLHPLWQRSLGFELCRVFPKIQFIVTSHSPFIAQAATDNGLVVLRLGASGRVEAVRPTSSVKGWRVDEILTSPLFGLVGTRDEVTEGLIRRHAELVAKRQWDQLSEAERAQLAQLDLELSSLLTQPGRSPEEGDKLRQMEEYVDRTLAEMGAGP